MRNQVVDVGNQHAVVPLDTAPSALHLRLRDGVDGDEGFHLVAAISDARMPVVNQQPHVPVVGIGETK